jgi:hypothetical protein
LRAAVLITAHARAGEARHLVHHSILALMSSQVSSALPFGLIKAPGRPQYPPFPPPGHHPVRDRHDDTPRSARLVCSDVVAQHER